MFKVIPSSDLRNKYADISKTLKEKHQPIVITNKGEADIVAMSVEHFEELEAELEFYKRIARNFEDINNGKYQTGEEFSAELQKLIKYEDPQFINQLEEKYTPKRGIKNV